MMTEEKRRGKIVAEVKKILIKLINDDLTIGKDFDPYQVYRRKDDCGHEITVTYTLGDDIMQDIVDLVDQSE